MGRLRLAEPGNMIVTAGLKSPTERSPTDSVYDERKQAGCCNFAGGPNHSQDTLQVQTGAPLQLRKQIYGGACSNTIPERPSCVHELQMYVPFENL